MLSVSDDGTVTAVGGDTDDFSVTIDHPTRVTLRVRYSGTVTNLRLTKTASAVPYKPYFSETYPIPASIRNLEGYGWSAGSVYNYIDYERKVFVQNVARVDISTLTDWDYGVAFRISYTDLSGQIDIYIPHDNSVCANIVCAKYATTPQDSQLEKGISFGFYDGSGEYKIAVNDDSYTTLSDWLTAMSGVYMYYQLATPIEVDISAYLTDDNLINVESGGTLTFPNSNGDDYLLPVNKFGAFCADHGTLKDILDKESGFIDGEYLDSISQEINRKASQVNEVIYGDIR